MNKAVSLSLLVLLLLPLAACAAPTVPATGAPTPTEPPARQTQTAFEAQFLASVEQRRNAILASPTTITVTGTAYFVSNTGDDGNDGRSQATAWASLDRVDHASLAPGDGVFFQRGGLWRGQLVARKGVTYSAYGEGKKPAIYGSPEDAADPSRWSLLDGTTNIWVYFQKLPDVGALVFDDGKQWTTKALPSFADGKYVLRDNHQAVFDVKTGLTHDLELFSEVDKFLVDGAPYRPGTEDDSDNSGRLYLRCDEGNPGAVFKSIEILVRTTVIVPADQTTFDNLSIKYTGGHALYTWGNRVTVQNCEFGWIGGSIQYYDPNTNDPIRFGNAVESDGSYDGYKVLNNYIYQVYDAGASNQESDPDHTYVSLAQNITYAGNLIEYCTYGIEIFLNTGAPDVNQHMLKNLLVDDNYILYSGYGWGNQRPDINTASSIQMWDDPNPAEDFVIQNNVFYLSTNTLIRSGAEAQWQPKLSGNTYAQGPRGLLGGWRPLDGYAIRWYPIVGPDMAGILHDVFRDETGIVIFLPGAG